MRNSVPALLNTLIADPRRTNNPNIFLKPFLDYHLHACTAISFHLNLRLSPLFNCSLAHPQTHPVQPPQLTLHFVTLSTFDPTLNQPIHISQHTMSSTTYTICTNYHGQTHNTHYWPDGAGQVVDGYVTDFEQYCDDLGHHINDECTLDFVIITSRAESKRITDSDDLQAAVTHLHDGAVLSVQALDKNTKRKAKRAKNEKHVNVDSDTEADTDDEYSEWNATNAHPAHAVMKYNKVLGLLDHFASHLGASCYHCEETEFSGRRYKYAYSTGYSLCGACHDNLSEEDAEDWNNSGLPWDGDAPRAPLDRRHDYAVLDGVKHLQYLLTRLGHMHLSDTAMQTGSYQGNTERGVASFRKKYGIHGVDTTAYDKNTAAKLAEIVKQLRSEGHYYL